MRQSDTGSIGDYLEYKAWLSAGTYSLQTIYHKAAGHASGVTAKIDGTGVEVLDMTGAALNQVAVETGIVVASSGLKTIRYEVTADIGGGGDCKMSLVCFAFWRTA
jgi:hypothetical protein